MNSGISTPDFILSHSSSGGILKNEAHIAETSPIFAVMAVLVVEDMYTGLFFFGNGVCYVSGSDSVEDTK